MDLYIKSLIHLHGVVLNHFYFYLLLYLCRSWDLLGRTRRRWIDNIKIDLLEIGLTVVDWIGLAQDRYRWTALVNVVMNLWVP
jgi:hypothetical protein